MGFEMAVEFVDTCSQQSDLHFRRTGVVFAARIFRNDGGLVDIFDRHDYLSHAVNGVATPGTVNKQLKNLVELARGASITEFLFAFKYLADSPLLLGFMQNYRTILACASLSILLVACAAPKPVEVGYDEVQVIAARGKPTHRYSLADGQLLEYNYGPYGQQTYMARLDANGKLISFEQVLTNQKFTQIQIDKFNKTDVLRAIGAPSRKTYFPLSRLEMWLYPYRDNEVWNAILYLGFDDAGIVRKLEKTPDLEFVPQPGLFGANPR